MVKKIIIAKNIQDARNIAAKYKNKSKVVAIEAEWGDDALEEPLVDLSINHHGSRSHNPCPAEIGIKRPDILNSSFKENTIYIVSHLDADTIMGLMWLEGAIQNSEEINKLSEMIAYSDKNGYHNAEKLYSNIKDTEIYKKWITMGYVFSRNSKSSPGDITNKVNGIIYAIRNIIYHKDITNTVVYKEATEWNKNKTKNARKALVYKSKDILGFSGKLFYCNNYNLLEDKQRDIVIQFDTEYKNILISVINKTTAIKYFGEQGVISVLQEFFGPGAGGHTTIGGAPRNKKYSEKEFFEFIEFIEKKIENI